MKPAHTLDLQKKTWTLRQRKWRWTFQKVRTAKSKSRWIWHGTSREKQHWNNLRFRWMEKYRPSNILWIFQLNKLGDYLTKEQRQRILDIAKVMFPNAEKGLYTEEITQRQKKNREKAPGPYGQRTSSFPGTLVATAQARGMTVGHSAPAPGVNPAAKSGRVSYPIAGRGLSCLGSPAAPGKAVSNVLPVTFSRQFRHKKTPCASIAQGVFS